MVVYTSKHQHLEIRLLQKELAKQETELVHGKSNFEAAKNASEILFQKGGAAIDGLKNMNENLFLEVFEGVPQAQVSLDLTGTLSIIDALSEFIN